MALKRAVWFGFSAHSLFLPWQQASLDVRQNTTLGDGDTVHEAVQLLVVADGQLKMAGIDPALLVVSCGIPCELKYLSGQVLHDGSQVDGSTSSDTVGIVATTQETLNSADGELQTSSA